MSRNALNLRTFRTNFATASLMPIEDRRGVRQWW
jgi:hypothetical protein